jgi:hypothetical protein
VQAARRPEAQRKLRRSVGASRASTCANLFVAVLLLAGAGGCVDFVGPEEPGKPLQDAQLVLTMTLVDGGDLAECDVACDSATATPTGTLIVNARFFPGTDAEGWFRPVMDTLRVADAVLGPAVVDAEGWRRYDSIWTIPTPGPGASVSARLPVPLDGNGSESDPFSLRWVVAGRAGPARLVLPATGDVLLHLTDRPGAPDPAPSFERWQLELSAGGPIFTFGTVGRPPASILIPRAWLPHSPGGIVEAKLVLDQRVNVTVSPGYVATAALRAELLWTLETS